MKIPELWLGDVRSYQQVIDAVNWGLEHPDFRPPELQVSLQGHDDDDEEETLSEMLANMLISKEGSVGLINIDGPLVNEESFWNGIFGLVAYSSIATALNTLLEDEEVEQIVLQLGTPGGDAQGLEGLTDNISYAREIKPITAWSGTNALSAGYWIAAAANRVTGAKMAEFGSIGVVTTVTTYAEALKKEGISVDIIRAGKYKAPAHPAENLSDKARDILQERTDRMYDFFLQHVAKERDLDLSAKDQWAEGRVFFAAEAVPVGLVDEVVSLNELVTRLDSMSEINSGDGTMAKQVILSDTARAQIASGARLEDVEHKVVETGGGTDETASTLDQGVNQIETVQASEKVEETPKDVKEPAQSELVTYLQDEIAKLRPQLLEAQQAAAKFETRAVEYEAQVAALTAIAIEATHRLQVSLGQTPMELSDMPVSTIVMYYGKHKAAFEEKFKVGRTSLDADSGPVTTVEVRARALGITPEE